MKSNEDRISGKKEREIGRSDWIKQDRDSKRKRKRNGEGARDNDKKWERNR